MGGRPQPAAGGAGRVARAAPCRPGSWGIRPRRARRGSICSWRARWPL